MYTYDSTTSCFSVGQTDCGLIILAVNTSDIFGLNNLPCFQIHK